MDPLFVLSCRRVNHDSYIELKTHLDYLLNRQRTFREVKLEKLAYDPQARHLSASLRGPQEELQLLKRMLLRLAEAHEPELVQAEEGA